MGVEEAAGAPASEDPVGYFLQDMTFHGRSDRTRSAYERVLRDFEAFVEGEGAGLETATRRECMAWVHSIRDEHAESTVASYASYVHRFYAYMTQVGALESNPMALVTEEMDESIDADPARREISVPEMRSFVTSLRHPLERAVVGTIAIPFEVRQLLPETETLGCIAGGDSHREFEFVEAGTGLLNDRVDHRELTLELIGVDTGPARKRPELERPTGRDQQTHRCSRRRDPLVRLVNDEVIVARKGHIKRALVSTRLIHEPDERQGEIPIQIGRLRKTPASRPDEGSTQQCKGTTAGQTSRTALSRGHCWSLGDAARLIFGSSY